MKFLLYDRHYTPRKAVLHWVSAFLAFGPIPILLHFFTVEYDLFQGVFVGSFCSGPLNDWRGLTNSDINILNAILKGVWGEQ
jgi:hypothetical protein